MILRELEHRPFLLLFLALGIGMSFVYGWWHPLLVGLLGFALLDQMRSRIVLLIGLSLGVIFAPDPTPPPLIESRVWQGQIRVNTVALTYGNRQRVEASSELGVLIVDLPAHMEVSIGDDLAVGGLLGPVREWRLHSGPRATLTTVGFVKPLRSGFIGWRLGLWIRKSFESFLGQFARSETRASLEALVFSNTVGLTQELNDKFTRSGLAHILSVSGLHVIILAFALMRVFGGLPIPKAVQIALLFGVLVIYGGASGLKPPIVRSILMALIVFSAPLWRRQADGLSAVGLAGSIGLLIDPTSITDAGFLLSYAGVAGLAMFVPNVEAPQEFWPWLRWFFGLTIRTSAVAFAATAPLTACLFGTVSLISIASNLLVVSFLPLIICSALLSWLAWLFVPILGGFGLNYICEPFCGWMLLVVDSAASLPFASVYVPAFSPYWLGGFYGLACLGWRPPFRPSG